MEEASYRGKMRGNMVAIATRILQTEGLAALQARRVAAEAGCAVGTLYNVFGGLDHLIIEANTNTLTALGDVLEIADERGRTREVADRLSALAMAYLGFAADNQKAWRALFEHQMGPGGQVPEAYVERQTALFQRVETIVADFFPDAAARRSAARALFSAVHGIVTISLDQKLGEFDHAEAERQVSFVVRAIAAGLEQSRRDQQR